MKSNISLPIWRIEHALQNLTDTNFTKTSERTNDYNCVAFAFDEFELWWWPTEQDGNYWPEGFPKEESIENFKNTFGKFGYFECAEIEYEKGFEKIAIYINENQPSHIAKQLENGKWKSKLGSLEDIQHDSLDVLCGKLYGNKYLIMKREQ